MVLLMMLRDHIVDIVDILKKWKLKTAPNVVAVPIGERVDVETDVICSFAAMFTVISKVPTCCLTCRSDGCSTPSIPAAESQFIAWIAH